MDFLLTPTRERDAAEAFFHKAICTQGLPEKITIDKGGANPSASTPDNKTPNTASILRQAKDLNNLGAQAQRAGKRVGRPRVGFKSFWAVRCTSAGIEGRRASRKGQVLMPEPARQAPAEQFSTLAA